MGVGRTGLHPQGVCIKKMIPADELQTVYVLHRAHKESVTELLGNPASVNPKLEEVPRPVEESSGGYAATIMGAGPISENHAEPKEPVSALLCIA